MDKDDAPKKAKGSVRVQQQACKGCTFCVAFCPAQCLQMSSQLNVKGYHFPVLSRPEACTGCDLCGLYCPDFAIRGFRIR
jgi:2-oxoglutarate ferredoxin oxidoreductase subunit delta